MGCSVSLVFCSEKPLQLLNYSTNFHIGFGQLEINRQILFSMSRTILFYCKQNIPLRGHRYDAKHLVEQCNNAGNFQCLSDLMALCGDKILSDHFKNGPKNATYRSKTVQNELIDICAGVVQLLLTDRIKKAKFFSILADEASDVSQTEYMAIIVRYIDECCKVKEDFLKFISCNTGLNGVSLSTKIKKSIHKLGMEKSYCRWQGYDGAGNMAGRLCGIAALILKEFFKAPCVHCFFNKLSLCVAKACAIPSIRNMMDHVRIISDFFNNSPKRLEDLSSKINEQFRHHLFKRQSMFFEPSGLNELMSSIDISHTEWYKEAVSIAATTSTMPSKPRTCGQQTQRDNHEVDNISEYYRVTCSIPFLDHILIQQDTLFSLENLVLLDSFSIIPLNLISD
ncbi:52 kDa repressor of the inhibitor of the protein kinase-like [Hydra vulgaris]|uniref:52 kDa repressor of the inhibitor of the protein kinase-like n=1 Tax=Hydra vulgaris TaxID=6087 RepID=A0ABM4BZE3_HYDVU